MAAKQHTIVNRTSIIGAGKVTETRHAEGTVQWIGSNRMYNATPNTSLSKLTSDRDQEVFNKETSVLLTWSTPTWEKELQDITVEERDRGVELVCICKDLAHPSAKWFHKGREVFSDFHMKLRQEAGIARLTIKEIREQDSGTYKCVMTGDNGQLDTSCVLTIKATEIILPPVFVKELHDVEVDEGEQVELGVEVRGTPPVGVYWFHNNVEITRDNPHFLMASLGHVHTLSLLCTTGKYSGEYVCEAYNDFGDTDTFCFVEVREFEHLDPPGFVSHPSTVTATEGETITFTCQVKGQPTPTVLWERGGAIIATNPKYKITHIQEQHTLTIYNVNQADAGQYVCQLHGSGRELSQVCSLNVICDSYARNSSPAETVKTRLVYITETHETDQPERKGTLQQGTPDPLEMSDSFQHNNSSDTESRSEHAEEGIITDAYRTSYVEAQSTIYVQSSVAPQTQADDHDSRGQFQDQYNDGDHDSTSSTKLNVSSVLVTKNINRGELTKQQFAPETKPNYHSVLSKTHRNVEEKKVTINTGATDFRGILKHRVNSPSNPVTKPTEQQELTVGLQKSSSRQQVQQSKEIKVQNDNSKEDNLVYKLANMPVGQTFNTTLSRSAEFTSLPHSSRPALSSQELHNSSQPLTNKSSMQSNAVAGHRELTMIPIKSTNLVLSTEDNVVSSSIARHAVGSRETPASSEYVENVLSEHTFYLSPAPGRAEKQSTNMEVDKEQHMVISDINLTVRERNNAESVDGSATCFIHDKLLEKSERQEKHGSVDSPSCEQLFVSEIQIVSTRPEGRKEYVTAMSSHAEHSFKVPLNATSLPAAQSHTGRRGSFNDMINVKSVAQRPEASPPYKVSIVHINPEVPRSSSKPDELKMEVTSVSMSIPLRSSTSSPRSHSSSHSVSVPVYSPGQTSTDCTHDRQEDTDDVFADAGEERKSAHGERSSSSNEYKAILQSYGPIFTWEKAPWDVQEVVPDDSTFDVLKKNNTPENKSKDPVLLENAQVNDTSYQWKGSPKSAHSVISKVRSVSDCDIVPSSKTSQMSAKAAKSAVNDFRTVTLKPAASKVKSDLIKSKFMSASTECVFADVKLKSVSKMNDRWRKSQVSLNTEEFKVVPKSRDSVPRISQDLSQRTVKTTSNTGKTMTKFSENHKVSASNAKSINQYENMKPNNTNKIKMVAEKYEKSPPAIVPRTKSKGIGAKFEASMKESQVSNRNGFSSKPNSVKKNVTETSTLKSTSGCDLKSGKVSEKIQHWKVAEIKLSGNSEMKMLRSIGKSNSHGAILESDRTLHPDKIPDSAYKKRHSLQTNEIPTSQSITVQKTEFVAPIKGISRTSQVFEKAQVTMDMADLNDNSHVQTRQMINLTQPDTQAFKSDSLFDSGVQQAGLGTVEANILEEQNVKQAISRNLKVDTSGNKNICVNKAELSSRQKGESPKAVQNKQDAKPDWINRKTLNNVENKVSANISDKNPQTKRKSEWVSTRSSKQNQQTEFTKDNKHMAEFKLSTGLRNTRKEEQNSFEHVTSKKSGSDNVESHKINVASLDSKQDVASSELNDEEKAVVFGKPATAKLTTNGAVSGIKTLTRPDNAVMVQTAKLVTKITPTFGFLDSPPSSSNVLASSEVASSRATVGADRVSATAESSNIQEPADISHSISAAIDTEPSARFRRSSVTHGPLDEIRVSDIHVDANPVHTSTIARKDSPIDHTSKHTQACNEPSEEHLSHIRNMKSSWIKQKHLKSAPVHQSPDMALILYQEQLRSSMDDSESVLSTTSISSSSSDASTVTVDSGYPRYSSRKFLDNERIELQSKITYPEQSTASTTVSHPGKLDKEVKSTLDSFQMKKNLFEAADNKKNLGSQFKLGDSDRNIHILASNLKHTTGTREKVQCDAILSASEGISGPRASEGPQCTSDNKALSDLEQASRHGRQFVNEVTAAQETTKEKCKNPEESTDVKDTEDVADLTNDFGTTRKYSKKRRKHQLLDVSEVVITSPDEVKPASKCVAESKAHENDTEIVKIEPNIPFKSQEPTDKCQTKEAMTNCDSEGANQKFSSARRWRLRENLNEKDTIKAAKPHDNRSSIARPTDLDLTTRWRSRKPNSKPSTEDKDVKVASEIQEGINKPILAPTQGCAATTSVAPSLQPQQQPCPPSFPIPLRDTKVILGSTAVLHCQVIGDPRPEVKWLLNHKQLEPSGNIDIVYSQDIAQLTVKETFTEHVGDYSCWAKNVLGTVSTHCTLNLEAFNKTESRAFEGPVFVPPKIVSFATSTLTVARGAPLSLTATFTGVPSPIVRWMRGDRELVSDNHVQIVTETNSSCLTIESTTRSDAGKMSVCLTSATGADQASTNIYIEDVPGSPVGRPHVYDIDRNSASLSWCGPTYTEGCQVTHYIIEATTRQDQAWDVIVPHCKDQSCHILGLKPCTTYQFRVLAANKHGLSAPSEPSEAVYTTDPYRSPSDYESEAYADVFSPSVEIQSPDDLPFEPREVKINTDKQFEELYELDKEVGKGKFGIVYKCKHKTDETIWAAKIVKCREKDKNVIRREIEIMNKLRHPKLLMLWDAYESQRQMVLVTEYVGAGELFERVIGEDFVLTECDCIHFLRQICEGVNYMHSNNILHLDLKPENILCIAENSNRIKIIDFGLAQFYQPGQSTKVLFGTPEFIAPEVINYDEIGFATDMWSVGVICYVLLSGLSPFLGDNDAETLASVTSGEFDFDDEAFDEISDEAKDFISKLLVKKKENRLMTDQCLSHVWLTQHEDVRLRRRRLNTERLKRFMVRRKWLKTGNAVLAVSRLLKSSNLGSLSPISSNRSSVATPIISSQKSSVLRNAEIEVGVMQNESVPEKFIRNKPFSQLWRNTPPGELINTVENIVNAGQLPDCVGHDDSDYTDQNDNQIHGCQLAASGNDDNYNVNPVSTCTDPMNTVSSLCSTEITKDTITEEGSKANEQSLPAAPVFLKSMVNSDACVGDVSRFDVIVAGNPLPVVTWCFEGEEIHSDSRHTVDTNETTRSFSLIIRSIVEEDEGEYTCMAVNSQGKAVCVAELSVLDM